MSKTIAVFRFVLYGVVIGFLMWVCALMFYPLVYPFRNQIRRKKEKLPYRLGWFFLNDESDYGFEWWRKANKVNKKNLWNAYRWSAIRNPMWNLEKQIRPEPMHLLISVKGEITQGGKVLPGLPFAVLKWEDDEGNYQDNKGEYISIKHSKIGQKGGWYVSSNGKYYFRFSLAKNVWKNIWVELMLGTTDRYVVRFKIKKGITNPWLNRDDSIRENQKKLLIQIMASDEKDGLYDHCFKKGISGEYCEDKCWECDYYDKKYSNVLIIKSDNEH